MSIKKAKWFLFAFIALCAFSQVENTAQNGLYNVISNALKKHIKENYKKNLERSKSNREKRKNATREASDNLKEALRVTGFDTIPFNINDTFCYFEESRTFSRKGFFYSVLFYNQEIKWAVRDSLNAEMKVINDWHLHMRKYYDFKNGNIDSITPNYLAPNTITGVRVIRKSKKKYETLTHSWQG